MLCCSRLCCAQCLQEFGQDEEGETDYSHHWIFKILYIWIVSENSLKNECKLKISEDILAKSVRHFGDKCPAQDKMASSSLSRSRIWLRLQQCARFGQDSVTTIKNRDVLRSFFLLQLEILHTKSRNQTDLMLQLEENPPQFYNQSFSMHVSVKPYAHFFIDSSARAIIQPVITLDS